MALSFSLRGVKLWKSDGSEVGTVLVKNVSAIDLINVNGTLFLQMMGAFGKVMALTKLAFIYSSVRKMKKLLLSKNMESRNNFPLP